MTFVTVLVSQLLRQTNKITNFTSQTVFMSGHAYGVLLSWNVGALY